MARSSCSYDGLKFIKFDELELGKLKCSIQKNKQALITGFPIGEGVREDFINFLNPLFNLVEHNSGSLDFVWDIKKVIGTNSKVATFSEHNNCAMYHTDSQYSD